jgi:hypothetical protein
MLMLMLMLTADWLAKLGIWVYCCLQCILYEAY